MNKLSFTHTQSNFLINFKLMCHKHKLCNFCRYNLVIIDAEFDPLRDDEVLYAAKLRRAGVRVWEKCFAGQIHCLIGLMPGSKPLQEYEILIQTAMLDSFN
jgi:acetyl esterase/lipase